MNAGLTIPPGSARHLRTYRATTIPDHIQDDQVELHDAAGLLPTIDVNAVCSTSAMHLAHQETGHRVLRADRTDPLRPEPFIERRREADRRAALRLNDEARRRKFADMAAETAMAGAA